MFTDFRSWLENVLETKLSDSIDMSCAKYNYTGLIKRQKQCRTSFFVLVYRLFGLHNADYDQLFGPLQVRVLFTLRELIFTRTNFGEFGGLVKFLFSI